MVLRDSAEVTTDRVCVFIVLVQFCVTLLKQLLIGFVILLFEHGVA